MIKKENLKFDIISEPIPNVKFSPKSSANRKANIRDLKSR